MSRRSSWIGICLIIITAAVFGRVITFEFTIWDDNIVVWANPLLNPPTAAHTLRFWTEPYYTLYLPVTYSLWSLVAAAGWSEQADAWGNHLNPYLFHGLNLIVHMACVLAVWRLVRRLVGSEVAAAVGALLFALHPVQVEPVAWVTGTRDLLGTFFSMAAVLAFLDFRDATETRRRGAKALLATLLFVAALFSKPTAVVTPILAALAAAWEPRRWRKSEWILLAVWLIGAGMAALAAKIKQPVDPMLLAHQPPIWFRPIVALDALAFDGWKLIWPVHLGIDYGRTPIYLKESGHWMWTAAITILIAAVLIKTGRRGLICGGVFVAAVLPLLGLTPYRFQVYYGTVADRYLYPAMMGLSLGVALVLSKLMLPKRRRAMALAVAGIVLLVFAAGSFHQTGFWRDSTALFTRAIEVNRRSFAGYQNRGAVENHDGEFAAAAADFKALLRISPGAPEGYRGLSRAHLGLGQSAKALSEWEMALEGEARTVNAHGAMSPEFRGQLAEHYIEGASMAQSVNALNQARAWREKGALESNGGK